MNGAKVTRLGVDRAGGGVAFWAALLLTLGTQSAVFGGEAIRFSNSKPMVKAPQRNPLTREVEQASPGRNLNLGTDLVTPSFSISFVDPKEEKRQKRAAFEKKNWAFDKGEVDEDRETDEAFGIQSEEDFESAGEEDGQWLSPMRDDRSRSNAAQSRGPTQSRGAAPRPAPPRPSESQDSDKGSGKSLASALGAGAQLAPELRIRSSSASGDAGPSTLGAAAFSSGNLLNSRSASDGPAAPGSLTPGTALSRNSGFGLDSKAPLLPALGSSLSAPDPAALYERSARSPGGLSTDTGFWGARSQAESLSPGFGSSLLPRSDNSSPLMAPQQPLDQRRSFRDFEKPKFPGQ